MLTNNAPHMAEQNRNGSLNSLVNCRELEKTDENAGRKKEKGEVSCPIHKSHLKITGDVPRQAKWLC